MSFDPRDTEERLRTYVIGQTEQERMCLATLKIDGGYTNLEPRRPKGGPDGARDIMGPMFPAPSLHLYPLVLKVRVK